MVQSLEQYVAQATQAYQPAQTAIQNQLNALSGQLDTANQQINKNYAQQQAGLNRQRNLAAETASMQAAGSGGSFGGAANLANRKYYDQSFVPAQTQLQTNQANELAQTRQNYENRRTDLNSQLANFESQAKQQALQQYWADVEAERQRQAELQRQREAQAAQASQDQYLMDAIRNSDNNNASNKANTSFTDWLNNYTNYNSAYKNKITSLLTQAEDPNRSQAHKNMMANILKNSDVYKKYLRWRNS